MQRLIEWLYLRQKGNLVYYDCLTGCKTRTYYDRVAKVKYHGREVNIAFVDLDNLKKINDEYGHVVGSKKLKDVVAQLMQIQSVEDICRIGGDEFIVIGNFNPQDFEAVRDISYGVYTKEVFEDLSSAVAKADRCMYLHKKSKKT